MSGYYYPPQATPSEEEELDFAQPYVAQGEQPQQAFQSYHPQQMTPTLSQRQPFNEPQQLYHQSQQYPQQFVYPQTPAQGWITPTVPSNYPFEPRNVAPFPQYSDANAYSPEMTTAGPSRTSAGYLSPDPARRSRVSRSTSFASIASNASSVRSYSQSDVSRSVSPSAGEMVKWGYKNENGTWSCRYPGCSSRSTFSRGCDLRKHYKRHTKSLFCRVEGCPQATEGGFSSKKDRARHEAKHNPNIVCEWEGCDRLFSRVDNMVSCLIILRRAQKLTAHCRRIMSEGCTSASRPSNGT